MLQNPLWQRKRLEILNYADFRCQLCGCKTRMLHVHHSYYEKEKMPWEYPNGSMIVLCDKHHKWYHDLLKEEKEDRERRAMQQRYEAMPPFSPTLGPEQEHVQEDLSPTDAAELITQMRRALLEQ